MSRKSRRMPGIFIGSSFGSPWNSGSRSAGQKDRRIWSHMCLYSLLFRHSLHKGRFWDVRLSTITA